MSDTRHLDTAIAILGAGRTKTRKASGTIINLYDLGAAGVSVQVNGKEVWLAPDLGRARADAERRATLMRGYGRNVTIQEC